jgi:nucleoside-diphosphate-sugar epimerase
MIYLTGATGYIGSRLASRLSGHATRVRCLALPQDRIDPLKDLPVEVVRGDVTNLESLLPHGAGVSAIVHAAALMLPNRPADVRRVNVLGTRHVIECARRWGVRRVVYLSAVSAAYARKNAYGLSKHEAEQELLASGLDVTILRLTMVYGPNGGHHFRTVVSMLRRIPLVLPIIGPGSARLQPVWIDDVLDAVEGVLDAPGTHGRTYNVSGSTVVSFNDLADAIQARLGLRRVKLHVPFLPCLLAARALSPLLGHTSFSPDVVVGVTQDADIDHSALTQDCGFHPIDLEEGLRRALP